MRFLILLLLSPLAHSAEVFTWISQSPDRLDQVRGYAVAMISFEDTINRVVGPMTISTLRGTIAQKQYSWYPRRLGTFDMEVIKTKHVDANKEASGTVNYCMKADLTFQKSFYDPFTRKAMQVTRKHQSCKSFWAQEVFFPEPIWSSPTYGSIFDSMSCSFNFFGELGGATFTCSPEPFFGF